MKTTCRLGFWVVSTFNDSPPPPIQVIPQVIPMSTSDTQIFMLGFVEYFMYICCMYKYVSVGN
jgi:hypothetical protein